MKRVIEKLVLFLIFSLGAGTEAIAEDTFVDLLAIYTEDVEEYYGGPDGVEAAIRANLISTNESFVNSDIELRVRLVGVRKLENYQPRATLSADLEALTELDDVLDDVFVWQHDKAEGGVGADLVSLFRLNSAAGVAGVGWLLDRKEGYSFYSFTVVAMKRALSGLVLQHELGHNFGATHDRDNADESGGLFDYSFGHCFSAPNSFFDLCTLMSYAGQGEVRINYFSNPDINYDGVPTGVASGEFAADNARTLNSTKKVVSRYFDHIHRLPEANAGVDIEVEDSDNNGSEGIDLDGYLSSYEDRIVSWKWSWSGGSATGENPTANFTVGTKTVTLQIEDDEGNLSSDTMNVTVTRNAPIEKVFAGSSISYFVKSDGTSYFFGNGHLDVPDIGMYVNTPSGFPVTNIASIAVGESHTLFLKENGSLFGVGSNDFGQRGGGDNPKYVSSALEIESQGVTSIAAISNFSLITKSDGSLWSTGYSITGALGFGSEPHFIRFSEVIGSGVQSVFAGYDFSLFLKTDGSLWGMGEILNYVYGEDSQVERLVPANEIIDGGVMDVATGQDHAVILKDDGSVWTFGRHNTNGELGIVNGSHSRLPMKVMDSGATAVYAGAFSTYVVLEDGSLWGAGLGTGSDPQSVDTIFKRMLGGHVVDVAAGDAQVLALRSDGSLWGKGSNLNGELGLGIQSTVPTFAEIVSPTSSVSNSTPIADAGSDLLTGGIFNGGSSTVDLNGAASTDDWYIANWNWTWSGGSAQGEQPRGISFPEGTTTVQLEVTDNNGAQDTDTVEVFVSGESDFRSRLREYFTQDEIDAMTDIYSADTDQDGLINKGEILLGLDPSDYGSRLDVEEVKSVDGLLVIVRGISDSVDLSILGSNDLLNWANLGITPKWIDENSVSFNLGTMSYEFFKVQVQ